MTQATPCPDARLLEHTQVQVTARRGASADSINHAVDYCGSNQIGKHWLARMGNRTRTVLAKNAKYNFGELIDKARAAPVTVAKYDRAVVVVMAVEEYDG